MTTDAYRRSGVDIDAGNAAAERYAGLAKRTQRPEVIGGIGGFSGGFQLDTDRYRQPVLVSGTDGVGTKLKIAFATGRHDTVGIDCVAMSVNDILTSGAEPLFFLDYLAVGKLDVAIAETIVRGVAAGCEQAGCALIGGETAEMGDMYGPGEYDLAGTAVGVVNRTGLIDGAGIQPGDLVVGLHSNGLHANGFSLVRQLVAEARLDWGDCVPGWRGTVADELLQPTRIYVKAIQALLHGEVTVKGMAHITGGGLIDNIPRCLPPDASVTLDPQAWTVPPVFGWLIRQGNMRFAEAARVWNMGIGYIVILPQEDATTALQTLQAAGYDANIIGRVSAGNQTVALEESL